MENPDEFAKNYSSQMATQMRKGLLGYFILLIAREPVYASEESPSGPPRKYYHLTDRGHAVVDNLHDEVTSLNAATNILKGEN